MKLRSISNRGICSPYRKPEPTVLDLDAIGPGVIALSGPNGSGKSSLLESLPAALYQVLPYRHPESLYKYASGKDSLAEAIFDDGGRTIRATCRFDAEKRKCERTLSIDGEEPITGARAYAQEIRRLFGSLESFLATVFAPQSQRGNLCEIPTRDRKALFAEFIGAGRYATYHERAKAERDRIAGDLDSLRRETLEAEREVEAAEELENKRALASQTLEDAAATVMARRRKESDAIAAVERARGAAERLASLQGQVDSAREALKAAEKALREAEARPAELKRQHEQTLRFIAGGVPDTAPLYDAHAEAVKSLDARRARLERQLTDLPDVEGTREALEAARKEIAEIEAADRAAQGAAENVQRRQAEVDHARTVLRSAQIAREKEVGRLRTQAGLIGEVPCTEYETWRPPADESPGVGPETADLAGTCPLLTNARAAKDELERMQEPMLLPEYEAVGGAEERLRDAQQEAEAAARGEDDRRARHRELTLKVEQLTGDLARAEAAPQLREDLQEVTAERQRVDARLEADLAGARKKASEAETKRQDSIGAYTADLAGANHGISQARKERDRLQGRHAAAADTLAKAAADVVDVRTADAHKAYATKAREDAEAALREADQAVTRLQAQIDALKEKEAALEPKRKRSRELETALGDWRLLADATGKDGIPQLRIDAAGPEVSGTATEILRAIWGTRFALEIRTQGETLKGKATEEFDIVVHDGAEVREVGDLSGGEKVLVQTAISLACAIYVRAKSGIDWRTLIMDEPGGGLDVASARQWVPMLQRVREIGSFHQIIFVSHNPEMVAGADAVVHVEDGRLTVEGAGAREAA